MGTNPCAMTIATMGTNPIQMQARGQFRNWIQTIAFQRSPARTLEITSARTFTTGSGALGQARRTTGRRYFQVFNFAYPSFNHRHLGQAAKRRTEGPIMQEHVQLPKFQLPALSEPIYDDLNARTHFRRKGGVLLRGRDNSLHISVVNILRFNGYAL